MAAGVFYGAVRDTGDRLGQSYRAGGGSRKIPTDLKVGTKDEDQVIKMVL